MTEFMPDEITEKRLREITCALERIATSLEILTGQKYDRKPAQSFGDIIQDAFGVCPVGEV